MQINYVWGLVVVIILVIGIWVIINALKRPKTAQLPEESGGEMFAYKNGLPITPRRERVALTEQAVGRENDDDENDALKHMADVATSQREFMQDDEIGTQTLDDVAMPDSYPVGQPQPVHGIDVGLVQESSIVKQHVQAQQNYDSQSQSAAQITSSADDWILLQLYPQNHHANFSGSQILKIAKDYNFKHGANQMFYRYDNSGLQGDDNIMFRVSGLESAYPRGFNINTLKDDQYEGLCFFVQKSSPLAVEGFDVLQYILRGLVQDLDAILCTADGFEVHASDLDDIRLQLQPYGY